MEVYKAHVREDTGEVQTVKQHSESTADLCRSFAIAELQDLAYGIGLAHDIGKYQPSFQRRISGENVRVEHSGCGAVVMKEKLGYCSGYLAGLCIAGHHAGLPDSGSLGDTADKSTYYGRLQREFERYDAYQSQLELPEVDEPQFVRFLVEDCDNQKEKVVDKLAFLVRYCFSCLVDADSLDTARFCEGEKDRALTTDFAACLSRLNETFASFHCTTRLQKARSVLQQQVFDQVDAQGEIFLMNMPTGSGKTLCSMKFALERAIRSGKKRIIYIIPYNSIIDQTAETLQTIFGSSAQILRHQSTFSYEGKEGGQADDNEDYRKTAKYASENWDAQLIITTAVQFFESIYSNRRGKLRKLHNMADSILVFDEAHLMPVEYLQPCLQAISYITHYFHSEAVFLTATMPNFQDLIENYALPSSKIVNLIEDTSLFPLFQKCAFHTLGVISEESLLARSGAAPSSLIVVNTRMSARRLYHLCGGKKYHLSTYMTSFDRKRVIGVIKAELAALAQAYPDLTNVPYEKRITVISTSLIEAGVDLDFHTVFRELSGLDSVLQAAGRCNREGKREMADVFVFELESEKGKPSFNAYGNITKGLMNQSADLPAWIQDYYQKLYFIERDKIEQNTMHKLCMDITGIPFKAYADQFEMISTKTISVAVERDETSRKLIEEMRLTGVVNVKALQPYGFSIKRHELEKLMAQHVVCDYGSGVLCLTNPDYYDEEVGVVFEGKDYAIGEEGGFVL